MRSATCLLAAAAAAAAAAGATGQTFRLKAVDSVSLSRSAPFVWKDNRIRAFRQPRVQLAICGAYRFDLSPVPKDHPITSIKLTLWLEKGFGNPSNRPVVDLRHSKGVAWTRATATPAKIPLGDVVVRGATGFALPKHSFDLDLAAHDFGPDIQAGALTLVVENVRTDAASFVYFFGHAGLPAGPNAELEVVVRPCRGRVGPFGTGGLDSWDTQHGLAATGCAEPGGQLTLTSRVSPQHKTPILLWTGASNTRWGTIPLPLDLLRFGAPGNHLYISLDAGPVPIENKGGGGTLLVPIPKDRTLVGVRLFLQAVLSDSFANPLQLVFSNGVGVVIG